MLLVYGMSGAASVCQLDAPPEKNPHQARVHMLLSPRMPYALAEWPRMADIARQAGFDVVAYRDPRVPVTEWQAAVGSRGMADMLERPALDAETAAACGMLNHAPAALVARCGHTHPWPILGVMPSEAWRHVLQSRSDDLERQWCR